LPFSTNSPAIDVGIDLGDANGYSLTPENVYEHPSNYAQRIIDGPIDIGAYETQISSSISGLSETNVIVYPPDHLIIKINFAILICYL